MVGGRRKYSLPRYLVCLLLVYLRVSRQIPTEDGSTHSLKRPVSSCLLEAGWSCVTCLRSKERILPHPVEGNSEPVLFHHAYCIDIIAGKTTYVRRQIVWTGEWIDV